jgi:hypothetical protein
VKDPRYPDVHVRLLGEDGNAGSIMGRVTDALRRQAKVGHAVCDEFRMQATSGNYDHLLQTVMAWVTVDDFEDDDGWENETGAESILMDQIRKVETDNERLRAEIEALKSERK